MDGEAVAQIAYIIYRHSCKEFLAEPRFKLTSFNSEALSRFYDGPVDNGTQYFWPHIGCLYSKNSFLACRGDVEECMVPV